MNYRRVINLVFSLGPEFIAGLEENVSQGGCIIC